MKTPVFTRLLAYYHRKLPKEEEDQILADLLSQPAFAYVILGLKKTEASLPPGKDLESFLQEKQDALRKKLFP